MTPNGTCRRRRRRRAARRGAEPGGSCWRAREAEKAVVGSAVASPGESCWRPPGPQARRSPRRLVCARSRPRPLFCVRRVDCASGIMCGKGTAVGGRVAGVAEVRRRRERECGECEVWVLGARAGAGVHLGEHLRGGRAQQGTLGANGAASRGEGNLEGRKMCIEKGETSEGIEVWRGMPSREPTR